jgi:DNA-binding transcriptional ArsR family regulator
MHDMLGSVEILGRHRPRVARAPPGRGSASPSTGKPALACKPGLAYYLSVADVYSAIADPTRRAILDELTDRNGQTLFEICSRLTMKHGLSSTRQAISQHLDVLESAGLVTSTREGRYKFHFFNPAPLHAIVERWPINNAEEAL